MPIAGFDEKIKATLIKVWAVQDYVVIFTVTAALFYTVALDGNILPTFYNL